MIARIRDEHHTSWARWRPTASREAAALARAAPVSTARARALSWRGAVALLAAAAAIAAGGLAPVGQLSAGRGGLRLPASPRAWLDAYEAAAIDNPSRVCSALFSPQLAEAYGKAIGGGAARPTSSRSRASRCSSAACCRTAIPQCSNCARRCGRGIGRWYSAAGRTAGRRSICSPANRCADSAAPHGRMTGCAPRRQPA